MCGRRRLLLLVLCCALPAHAAWGDGEGNIQSSTEPAITSDTAAVGDPVVDPLNCRGDPGGLALSWDESEPPGAASVIDVRLLLCDVDLVVSIDALRADEAGGEDVADEQPAAAWFSQGAGGSRAARPRHDCVLELEDDPEWVILHHASVFIVPEPRSATLLAMSLLTVVRRRRPR